jgi:hypothetical protein
LKRLFAASGDELAEYIYLNMGVFTHLQELQEPVDEILQIFK